MKHFLLLIGFLICLSPLAARQADPPPAFGPIPSPQQVAWQQLEYYMFIHFGPNTFTDVEWGQGDEDPGVFNPSQLDARQWARIAKAAGMKAIIITAKHHDGFCLWPSEYSTHTVRESPWKNGQGDVLKELSEACKEFGLKFGVYLSPWDMNHPSYGTPEYNEIFAKTLEEVLSNYGEVFEQWFDGANGEGPNGKKQVYDWPMFHDVVYRNQPNAIIFSDVGPGCRWVGNESGFAGETNWSTLNVRGFEPGIHAPKPSVLNEGNENGEEWVPAESDVSIRPGWFYSPSTDDKVKSLDQLLKIYYASVGRNSNLLLNVPIDRRGLIHPADSARLMEFREVLDASFRTNLARGKDVQASESRGNDSRYQAGNLTDGDYTTYWTTRDGISQASFTLDLGGDEEFNRLVLQEYIPLGQRVKEFSVEIWNGNEFELINRQTTIGYKRILVFPAVTTSKIRVNILESKAAPVIAELQIYRAPEKLALPEVKRDREGRVEVNNQSLDAVITYTTDGSEPDYQARRFKGSFDFSEGGTIKAKAFIKNGQESTATITKHFDLVPAGWNVVSVSSEAPGFESRLAIDADPGTYWHTAKEERQNIPHQIVVDLGKEQLIQGFYYTPHQQAGASASGTIYQYSFLISEDGTHWENVVDQGIFANIKNNPIQQRVRFNRSYKCRYIKLISHASTNENNEAASVAEIGIIRK